MGVSRQILLVKTGGEAAISEWRALFAELAPGLDVRWWDDPGANPDDVNFVLVWQPEAGRLARYRNLRVIFSSGAGVDHITCDPELPADIPIVRMASQETLRTMGEYVCLAVLAIQRDLLRVIAARAACRWDEFAAQRTAQQTRVGVMGLGNIGQTAAHMLRALGYQLSGWAQSRKSIADVTSFAGMEELDAFLQQSDILVGLLPETLNTRHLLDAARLAKLPTGAGVVNAGRGSLIVMPDLIAALDSGHLSAALLDVFEDEPLPASDPLWRHPRILVTCHIAGFASRRARAEHVARGLNAYWSGQTLPSVFKLDRGY
ncbi:MAG TPA: glyoxylate/hydroxypyruvate reductase A [Acetobacteraceae bacterium]